MTPKVLIVRRPQDGYAGMERPRIEGAQEVPLPVRLEAAGLEDLDMGEAIVRARALLQRMPDSQWEIIVAGAPPLEHAERLGYDVGETLESCWSAIKHADAFLDDSARANWEERCNEYGLFMDRPDADAYLHAYLESDRDEDKGWAVDGWQDEPDYYAVLLIQRIK